MGGVMEKIRPYLLGAALTAVVIFGMAQAQAPNGPRWEYIYIEQAGVQFELRDRNAAGRGPRLLQAKLLNQLGTDGWEMVQAGVGGYVFKRRLP